ncbi:hypothetical protein R1sor_017304 [Riccia sorocarpa]|uniref:Uncharacterized protein n=1 Tax=Riccia sorocarpa TaxID=122646 RepID=A0ABD3IAG6_9MARC
MEVEVPTSYTPSVKTSSRYSISKIDESHTGYTIDLGGTRLTWRFLMASRQISLRNFYKYYPVDIPQEKILGRLFACQFRCDCLALGCFMIPMMEKFAGAEVVRTRDQKILVTLDAVLDVGGIYNPEIDPSRSQPLVHLFLKQVKMMRTVLRYDLHIRINPFVFTSFLVSILKVLYDQFVITLALEETVP